MTRILPFTLALVVGLLTLACSDDETQLRLDELQGRVSQLETQSHAQNTTAASLYTKQEEQQQQITRLQTTQNDLLAQRQRSNTNQDVIILAGQAARCYLVTEPQIDQLYPHIATDKRLEHIATEMIQEYHRMQADPNLQQYLALIQEIAARCQA